MNKRLVLTAALLAVTWLLWSGVFTPLLLGLGIVSCLLVTGMAVRTGFFDQEVFALHLGPRLPRYWAWLLREIVRSNFKVARIILHPDLPIRPSITRIDARKLSRVTQATFANSVTLTPGTLTIDINHGIIEVHCLTREAARDLEAGDMLIKAQELDDG